MKHFDTLILVTITLALFNAVIFGYNLARIFGHG